MTTPGVADRVAEPTAQGLETAPDPPAKPALDAAPHDVMRLEKVVVERQKGAEVFRVEIPSFIVRSGDKIALTGQSGGGKTTFLEALSLIKRPIRAERFTLTGGDGETADLARLAQTYGDVAYRDRTAHWRALDVHMSPQRGGLLPFLTARGNIDARPAIAAAGGRSFDAIVSALGIRDVLERRPSALSTGQQQRIAIARAAIGRPVVILADEPTAALDPTNAEAALALLTSVAASNGAALVIATHDAPLAKRFDFQIVAAEPTDPQGDVRGAQFRLGVQRPGAA